MRRLPTTLLVSILLATTVGADDWSERLVGPDAEAARAELIAMKRKAAPILAGVVREGEGEQAWAALRVFVELKEEGRGAAKELLEIVERDDAEAWRRSIAAFSIGAGGEKSKSAVKSLIRVLASEPDPDPSIAVRLALTAIGKDAAKPAAQLMLEAEGIRARQWGAQILFCMGEAASGAKSKLVEVIEDDRGYYLYAVAGEALKRTGASGAKAFEKAWEERRVKLPKQSGGGLPMPRKACQDNEFLFEILTSEGKAPGCPPLAEMALPASFGDFNGDDQTSAGEVVLVWGGFLAEKLAELNRALYVERSVPTFAAWEQLVDPVRKSCMGLKAILGKASRPADR